MAAHVSAGYSVRLWEYNVKLTDSKFLQKEKRKRRKKDWRKEKTKQKRKGKIKTISTLEMID